MLDNGISCINKENIFNVLVNMNKTIAKQKLETYGLADEAQRIKISGFKVQRTFGGNTASISNELMINDIEFKSVKNQFRNKVKKTLRVTIV